MKMNNVLKGTIIALGLTSALVMAAGPASAATIGVRVGDLGLGFKVGNGQYYDRNHHRQTYSYPSDWKSYSHSQSWYRSHPQWNDHSNPSWYRR
jgi:hypothetical protein